MITQAEPKAGGKAERLVFIDVLRGLAVMWMIETHVVNACLAESFRKGWLFAGLEISNGFVAVAFLFCAGAGFWIAADRKAAVYRRGGPALWKYLRRLGLILLLSYSLHLPIGSLRALLELTPQRMLTLWKTDILHVIVGASAVSLLLLLLVPSRRVLLGVFGGLALAVFYAAPLVLSWDSFAVLPPPLATWFAPPAVSRFSLFPWTGYFFAGAAATGLFMKSADKLRLARWFIAIGVVVPVLAFAVKQLQLPYPGYQPWWNNAPGHSLFRTAGVMLMFAALYLVNDWLGRSRVGRALQLCGQESLLIYYWHLIIVYGSVYHGGLGWLSRKLWEPWQIALVTVLVMALMYWSALMWRDFKLSRPKAAFWTIVTVIALFLAVFTLIPRLPTMK